MYRIHFRLAPCVDDTQAGFRPGIRISAYDRCYWIKTISAVRAWCSLCCSNPKLSLPFPWSNDEMELINGHCKGMVIASTSHVTDSDVIYFVLLYFFEHCDFAKTSPHRCRYTPGSLTAPRHCHGKPCRTIESERSEIETSIPITCNGSMVLHIQIFHRPVTLSLDQVSYTCKAVHSCAIYEYSYYTASPTFLFSNSSLSLTHQSNHPSLFIPPWTLERN